MSTRSMKLSRLAARHLDEVEAERDDGLKEKYQRLAKRLPGMVRRNGLLQVVAFLESKGGRECEMWLDHLSAAMRVDEAAPEGGEAGGEVTGVGSAALSAEDLGRYLLHTRTVLSALQWYKRFSVSRWGRRDD